jgi:hypothetical protein
MLLVDNYFGKIIANYFGKIIANYSGIIITIITIYLKNDLGINNYLYLL